jgi:hypothetical protein
LTKPHGDIAAPATPPASVEQAREKAAASKDELVVDDHSLTKAQGDAAEEATGSSKAADQQ